MDNYAIFAAIVSGDADADLPGRSAGVPAHRIRLPVGEKVAA